MENDPRALMIDKPETKEHESIPIDEKRKPIDSEGKSKEERSCVYFEKAGHTLEEALYEDETNESEDSKLSRCRKQTVSLLDIFIVVTVVAPLAIGCWRGVWGCMDSHAKLFPSWLCFTFGAILHTIYTILKDRFHKVYMKKWNRASWWKRLPRRALQVLYTYTFGIACIAHWRGGWIIIDNYLFMHMWINISVTCSLLVCLIILHSVRNLIATPLITQIDTASYVFIFPTRYNIVIRVSILVKWESLENGIQRCKEMLSIPFASTSCSMTIASLITALRAADPVLNCQMMFDNCTRNVVYREASADTQISSMTSVNQPVYYRITK